MSIQEALEIGGRIENPMDALMVGLQVTVIGLLIVFAVLIILMFVLKMMKFIFAPKAEKVPKVQKPKVVEQKPTAEVVEVNETDDEELIAVITAAIAASLNTSTYNLKIKSFRRVGSVAPAWNKAGLNETINSRF